MYARFIFLRTCGTTLLLFVICYFWQGRWRTLPIDGHKGRTLRDNGQTAGVLSFTDFTFLQMFQCMQNHRNGK